MAIDDKSRVEPRSRAMRASLDDAMDAAADLAMSLRQAAEDLGEVAGDQVARATRTAQELRDRTLSERALTAARRRPFLSSLRQSAHAALDIGFDLAGVAVDTGLDGIELLLRRRESGAAKPVLDQA